jgi:hypothetical protein
MMQNKEKNLFEEQNDEKRARAAFQVGDVMRYLLTSE